MKTKAAFLMFICSVLSWIAEGQTPGISFHQGKEIALEQTKNGYVELNIKPEPFTIVFEGNELHVCTGLKEDIFNYTKPKTDINADFNSCFYIFKFGAGSKDSQFLYVGNESPTSLNEVHGAKVEKKQSTYQVSTLFVNDKENPLSDFKEFYMALWLDSNKNQYIDEKELLKVKVNIK